MKNLVIIAVQRKYLKCFEKWQACKLELNIQLMKGNLFPDCRSALIAKPDKGHITISGTWIFPEVGVLL